MVKKIAVLAGAGALLLSMVTPAFGWGDVSAFNWSFLINMVQTSANSGDNEIHGMCVSDGSVQSGVASAVASVGNAVNPTDVGCLGCNKDVSVHNWSSLRNDVRTSANSGRNGISAGWVSGGSVVSGNAGASSIVENVVNSTMVGFFGF